MPAAAAYSLAFLYPLQELAGILSQFDKQMFVRLL
jgi:hypothetical protein